MNLYLAVGMFLLGAVIGAVWKYRQMMRQHEQQQRLAGRRGVPVFDVLAEKKPLPTDFELQPFDWASDDEPKGTGIAGNEH